MAKRKLIVIDAREIVANKIEIRQLISDARQNQDDLKIINPVEITSRADIMRELLDIFDTGEDFDIETKPGHIIIRTGKKYIEVNAKDILEGKLNLDTLITKAKEKGSCLKVTNIKAIPEAGKKNAGKYLDFVVLCTEKDVALSRENRDIHGCDCRMPESIRKALDKNRKRLKEMISERLNSGYSGIKGITPVNITGIDKNRG